ncbi:hypothetical protein CHELA1G2_14684 [Hyphomicrobiales bacterium]|nr:hypothetical protein CHELA1G2_14684 [Hyphomicrobiales bacterium]
MDDFAGYVEGTYFAMPGAQIAFRPAEVSDFIDIISELKMEIYKRYVFL